MELLACRRYSNQFKKYRSDASYSSDMESDVRFSYGDKVIITGENRRGEIGTYRYARATALGLLCLIDFGDQVQGLYPVDEFKKLSINL